MGNDPSCPLRAAYCPSSCSRSQSSSTPYNPSSPPSSPSSPPPPSNPSTPPSNTANFLHSASPAPSPRHTSVPSSCRFSLPNCSRTQNPGAYSIPGHNLSNQRYQLTIPRGIQPGQTFEVLVNGRTVTVRCPPGNREGDRLMISIPPSTTTPSPSPAPSLNFPPSPPPCSSESSETITPTTAQISRTPQPPPPLQPQPQLFQVHIPPGVRPGQQFRVLINNRAFLMTCPPNALPNQQISFSFPPCSGASTHHSQSQSAPPPQSPSSQSPSSTTESFSSQHHQPQPHPRPTQTSRPRPPCAAPNHQMFEVVVPNGVRPGQSFALVANGQRVMVTCPFNVSSGQKIRFQLPIRLTNEQLESVKVDYHKDGWMRCLGSDLNFHWVYNTATNADTTAATIRCPIYHRKCCELYRHAFVRELIQPICPRKGWDLRFVEASTYSMPSTVPGTKLNYQELSTAARYPFQDKCEWIKRQFNQIRIPCEAGHIKLKIRRSHLLADSIDSFDSLLPEDMRKIFRIEFIDEAGLDAGGLTREWYHLIASELFNPNCGLFQYSSVNQMCLQINPNSQVLNENHLRYYYFTGRFLGKSLMDSQITPIHLITPIYKHLLGYPIKLRDIEHIDNEVYRGLLELLSVDDVSLLYLDFTITEDRLGNTETISLLSHGGGGEVMVTNENLTEYLKEQLKYRLLTRIKSQLCELLRGFYEIVPEPFIAIFNSQELELLLHGIPNIDIVDWRRNTEYVGEFLNEENQIIIEWFWEIIQEYSEEERAKLLQFSTGTSGVPPQGFGYLQSHDGNIRKFTLMGSSEIRIFPRSHTCFNRIDLPIYETKEEMKKYLTMAITLESTGFELE